VCFLTVFLLALKQKNPPTQNEVILHSYFKEYGLVEVENSAQLGVKQCVMVTSY
jgi:hypothetical protein